MCTDKINTLTALAIAAAGKSLQIQIGTCLNEEELTRSYTYEIRGEGNELLFQRLEHAPSREEALSHLDDTLNYVLHAHASCPGDLNRAEKTTLVEWLKTHDEARAFELLPM